MANSIVARSYGDEYQQLVFWKYALKMLNDENNIESVCYEYDEVKSFDDIVIKYVSPKKFRGTSISREYIQAKFHMADNQLFTVDNLIDPSFIHATSESLLDKVVNARKKLDDDFIRSTFIIYSMWDVAQNDELNNIIDNVDSKFRLDKLFDGTTDRSKMGKIRKKWRERLGVSEEELKYIVSQVRIKSRQEKMDDLIDVINQQLDTHGLKLMPQNKYENQYTQLIQKLFQAGVKEFNKLSLKQYLRDEDLFVEKKDKKLIAIRNFEKHAENLDKKTDMFLELANFFDGRFLKQGNSWDETIYPLLCSFSKQICEEDIEYHIQLEVNPTIAFMMGRLLDIKVGKDIVPLQRTEKGVKVWAKEPITMEYPTVDINEIVVDESENDVAIVIGLSREIFGAVKEYIDEEKMKIGRIISYKFENVNSSSVLDGTHAWSLANQIKNIIDNRSKRERQGKLHIFMACPNAIVFLLARYSLNFGKIQLYEYDFNGQRTCTYYPTVMFPMKGEF